MERIVWEVEYLEPPPAIRYCRHCGGKREYLRLVDSGGLRSVPARDLRRCRLHQGILLLFGDGPSLEKTYPREQEGENNP